LHGGQVFVAPALIQAKFHLLASTPISVQLLDQKFFSPTKDKLSLAKVSEATSDKEINRLKYNPVGLVNGITSGNFLLHTLGHR
jgi:hypothetical protein